MERLCRVSSTYCGMHHVKLAALEWELLLYTTSVDTTSVDDNLIMTRSFQLHHVN
jgi:hypothetical protein